jgi:hypothetical protein
MFGDNSAERATVLEGQKRQIEVRSSSSGGGSLEGNAWNSSLILKEKKFEPCYSSCPRLVTVELLFLKRLVYRSGKLWVVLLLSLFTTGTEAAVIPIAFSQFLYFVQRWIITGFNDELCNFRIEIDMIRPCF